MYDFGHEMSIYVHLIWIMIQYTLGLLILDATYKSNGSRKYYGKLNLHSSSYLNRYAEDS
jgi:hypothetical protein